MLSEAKSVKESSVLIFEVFRSLLFSSVNLYPRNIATGTDIGTRFFPVLVEEFHITVSLSFFFFK